MDAHDSVRAKVHAIFEEMAGERAMQLRGNVNARRANDLLGAALAEDMDPLKADQLAFNLVDWNSDAAFVVATILFPERFTAEELRAGVDMFLIHAPSHVLTAARLGGYVARDLDLDEDAI